jgi:hypothetical protein
MGRLVAAEYVAAQRRSRLQLERLSIEQVLSLDAFFKEVMRLDVAVRASRSAELVRENPEIATALKALQDPAALAANRRCAAGTDGEW